MTDTTEEDKPLELTVESLRKLMLDDINHRARDTYDGYAASLAASRRFADDKHYLAYLAKQLNMTHEECRSALLIIIHDEEQPTKDADVELVDDAIAFVNEIYDSKGKYDGREAASLMRRLLERAANDELIEKFNEKAGF